MLNKRVENIFDVIMCGMLLIGLNRYYAADGQWFSWVGTGIAVAVIVVALLLELSGTWKRLNEYFINKLKK